MRTAAPAVVALVILILSAVFLYMGPSLAERATRSMRSTRARAVGMGALHASHFDMGVRPSRSTRRAMGGRRGLFGFWMLRDESGTITVPKLKDKREELNAVRKELADVFDQAGPELNMENVTVVDGDSEAKVDWIRQKNEKAGALAKEVADLEMLQRSAEIADAFDEGEPGSEDTKSTGFVDDLFESQAIKGYNGGGQGPAARIMLPETRQMRSTREQIQNALFTTGAGWAPESTRSGRIAYSAQEQPSVVDLVPMITTDQPLFKFMRETVFTNAATETAEGGAYAEATLTLAEASEEVRKITVWIGVTDEQLEDVPGARAYIESRLRFMLEQKLDQRLLYGNPAASPPQIRGFHNTAGINTASGLDRDIPDVVLDAATEARVVGQAAADGVVLHPYDWTRVRLQRTTDGIYIWGHPSQVGPSTLWGMPVVDSANEVEGAGLTGAFASQSLLVVRRGVDVQVSNSHDEFFVQGKQAVRADFRAALVTIRPGAFTEMDQLAEVTP